MNKTTPTPADNIWDDAAPAAAAAPAKPRTPKAEKDIKTVRESLDSPGL
jgi:hypothetical protein